MQPEKSLKSKLKANELTLGSWITLAHPAVAEIFSKAGFDWLTVDLEHSVITIREAEELIRIIDLSGVTPLVRLSSIDLVQIKRVLDAGAKGLIVPNVRHAADVNEVIKHMCYPPKGERGVGLARGQKYGPGFQDYLENFDKNKVLITQIENASAIQNIEEILSHPDVDGYILGPYDLSNSLGCPGEFEHPKMIAAIEKVKATGIKYGRPGGIHVIQPNKAELEMRKSQGFKFIAYSLDMRMLDFCAREIF